MIYGFNSLIVNRSILTYQIIYSHLRASYTQSILIYLYCRLISWCV